MAQVGDEWSSKSNDALAISLVTPADGTSKTIASFHPKFTYHIFGEEETIFGYQGLKVHLKYNACDMRPGLQVSYSKKFKSIGETEATDIEATLEEFLPKTAFVKTSAFNASINDDSYKDWKPPGELVKTLSVGNETYEIYKGSLMDKTIQQMIKRIQILVPLFIEGGSFIEMTDPDWSLRRWTVFFMYKNDLGKQTLGTSPYVFMGYSTVYRYLPIQCLTPPSSPPRKTPIRRPATLDFTLPITDLGFNPECRSRISQFLILPPFQGGGKGSRFYDAIYQHYLESSPETFEITVEDPNEDFDDLRDLNDLKRLRQVPEFMNLRINKDVTIHRKGRVPAGDIVDFQLRGAIRTKVKMAPRQFTRLVEMQLLSLIPTYIRKSLLIEQKRGTDTELKEKKHEYYLWQLFVKQRLYRHNKLSLMQLERSERLDKLEDVVGNVEADFARLLRTLEQREAPKKKRTLDDDGDDAGPASKKARVEDEEDA